MEGLEGLKKFFKNKKVFITGHTGFKGSWLTLMILTLGGEVIGYSLKPPTNPNLFEVLNLKKDIIHIEGDIRDRKFLKKSLKETKPDIVFHLAAQPLVRESYRNPIYTFETNVLGTLYLFEAVRESPSLRVVINVTSDKCYKNREWVYGYREIDPLGGKDPYSGSKACAEILTEVYNESFFNVKNYGKTHLVCLSSVRAGNVIGGGDWQKGRLIPDCVKALVIGKKIKIRHPKAVRPWQHVFEPLYGYLLLAKKMWEDPVKYRGAWNFGPFERDVARVEEVVKKVISFWGQGEYEVSQEELERYPESTLLRLDISKAMFCLSWKPVWNLERALKETIAWYKEFYQGTSDMKEFSLIQLNTYFSEREKRV